MEEYIYIVCGRQSQYMSLINWSFKHKTKTTSILKVDVQRQ